MKRALWIILAVFLVLIVIFFDLILYGIGQGIGQMRIIAGARPIEEMLADPEVDPQLKKNLERVEYIREFAINDLGLRNSENYTEVYDQKGKPVLWVVRACEPYALKNKEWTFPIVGKVSYKGFFDLDKAKRLRDELNDEGYDTYIREVSAWSTLGWFKDPLMSEVLNDSEGGLANTIIHELTHATIFVKDSLTFNENLASFIGDKGAEFYLANTYGVTSRQLQDYVDRKEDRARFSKHFIEGTRQLDSLYRSMGDLPEETKRMLKEKMIRKVVSALDTVSFASGNYGARFEHDLPNNAFFMSFLLYRSGQDNLEDLFANNYGGDVRQMIDDLKSKYDPDK